MLRHVLVLLAVFGMMLGSASSALAGVLNAPDSTFTLQLGGLPPIVITGTYTLGGTATLSDNGASHDLSDTTGIWSTVGKAPGTSLFTGVNLITNLVVTAANEAGAFTPSFTIQNPVGGNQTAPTSTAYSGTICPGGCLGGTETVSGQTVVFIAGNPSAFSNDIIGIGGVGTLMVGGATIAVTGGPFVTGKVRITNITTNIVQIPNRSPIATGPQFLLKVTSSEVVRTFTTLGGFITSGTVSAVLETQATVTIAGTNQLASASAAGQVTLVTPLRIDTGPLAVGNIPGSVTKTFVFVPEPGTLLLLASGAAGLVLIGRRRSRK